MALHRTISIVSALVLAAALLPASSNATPIANSATGQTNGVPLDAAAAVVNLNRVGQAVTTAMAEITPNNAMASTVAAPFTYHVLPEINPGDTGMNRLQIGIPGGYGSPAVTAVNVGGTALTAACPTPGAGQFCATYAGGMLSVATGDTIATTMTPVSIGFTADVPGTTGPSDFTSSVGFSSLLQSTIVGDANQVPGDANSITVDVSLTQGQVLALAKAANKTEAVVGEVVAYSVALTNLTDVDVIGVVVEDTLPPGFKYLKESARLDGAPMSEPTGSRSLQFDIGTIPGFFDTNGNGTLELGEPGYRLLTYRLVVGAGVTPGRYVNRAVAKDFCDTCLISNESQAAVDITLDPVFDLGTIVGKVFHDLDGDGLQDRGETGVRDAMVVLDDGTYVLTDEHGRYHFPAVLDGHRMLKINMNSLPPGTEATTDRSQVSWVTPGLMVRVNFGVKLRHVSETIGREPTPALGLLGEHELLPLELLGSTEALTALLNGDPIPLPAGDARLQLERLDDNIRMKGASIEPVSFGIESDPTATTRAWRFEILDAAGEVVRVFEGDGAAPQEIVWDGRDDRERLIRPGAVYQYQLHLEFAGGTKSSSSRRLFGVNRTEIIALNLLGDAFESGSSRLSPKAKTVLKQAATVLRKIPDEKILIEGHTDSIGTAESNLVLSRDRARSAARYLIDSMELNEERFVLRWFGEERPVAPNELEEGRVLNRRVEIKGELASEERVRILERYRAKPGVRVNGSELEVGVDGRFSARVDVNGDDAIELQLTDASGSSAFATVPVPKLDIDHPVGDFRVARDEGSNGCHANGGGGLTCLVRGRTDPGNSIELDGTTLAVAPDGAFEAALPLDLGQNVFGVLARNQAGYVRLTNLRVGVRDRDDRGHQLVIEDGVPNLVVQLPPSDVKLPSGRLRITGTTDPGNSVSANSLELAVNERGSFDEWIELPRGRSVLSVEVVDSEGRSGSIERPIEVARHELFMMAFADAKVGRLQGDGYLEAAGLDEESEYYTEGRVAFYLKGRIAGKYLITSAFDTGRGEFGELFDDLDSDATERLLTNLDPDKYYPVYGDGSTLVYDTESQGKLYLALDSEEIHALVGNYAVSLSDTDLSGYQRTLFGGKFVYQSASLTRYGEPDTQIIVFGAEVGQTHTRDEIRATGGSVYYLSHDELIEGSEEVTLVVRDQNTGLVLRRDRQRRNVDYTVKYEEGRVIFHRPISSVTQGGTLVNEELLGGDQVFVHVDYERRTRGLEKTASGGRVRQQINDQVSVGGTYVRDDLEAGTYELRGVDAELRLSERSRLTAEVADSSGSESGVFVSYDGGLSYTEVPADATREGTAYKAAAELDVGEWFGKPDRHKARLYFKELDPGFSSSGTRADQGSRRIGLDVDMILSESDSIRIGYDMDERDTDAISGYDAETRTGSALWRRDKTRWGVAVEYFHVDRIGNAQTVEDTSLASSRAWFKPTEKLTASLEHQQTLSGADNDQTTAGLEFQALPSLGLAFQGTSGSRGESAQAGVTYTRKDGELYLTERTEEHGASRSTATVVGARSPLGKSSKIYTEFQREDGDRGQRALRLLGLQRQWDPVSGLRVVFGGEFADVDNGGSADTRSALSAGVSFDNDSGLRAMNRSEVRFEDGSQRRRQYFTQNQLDLRLHPDLTLLARYRYSKTEDRDLDEIEARFDERVLGVAYRPVAQDRFNSLFRYTRLLDQRPALGGSIGPVRRVLDVLSLDTALRFSHRVEWLAKGAVRFEEDQSAALGGVDTSTYLGIQRLNYRLFQKLDLGLEYRVLSQQEADNRSDGWSSELTWKLFDSLRVGGGYNFTDVSDDEFSDLEYSVEGWFFRVQGKY